MPSLGCDGTMLGYSIGWLGDLGSRNDGIEPIFNEVEVMQVVHGNNMCIEPGYGVVGELEMLSVMERIK
jgi:hypothetical protein